MDHVTTVFIDFETTGLGDARAIDITQVSMRTADGVRFSAHVTPRQRAKSP